MAKPHAKSDKETSEVEYERNADELTFHPDRAFTKGNQHRYRSEKYSYVVNMEKNIDRMRTASNHRDYLAWWKDGARGQFPPNKHYIMDNLSYD